MEFSVSIKNKHLGKPAAYPRRAHAAGKNTVSAFSALKLINDCPIIKKENCRPGADIHASAAPYTFININLHTFLPLVYCCY